MKIAYIILFRLNDWTITISLLIKIKPQIKLLLIYY